MRNVQRPTRRMSRRWTWPLAVALLTPVGSATAASHVASTTSGVVAGVTTIRWSGTAKITLNVPRTLSGFTEDRMRLLVSGGRYAFVRIVSPLSPVCPPVNPPHCSTIRLDYIADLATRMNYPTHGPGHDHSTDLPFDPPFLDRGPTTFYLFTDRQATLEVHAPGLTGRTSYVARGTFRGKAERLPIRCATGTCSPTSSDPLLYGGSAFDLGSKGGSVDTVAYSATVDSDVAGGAAPANQPHGLRQCVYPNYRSAPTASADPSGHPYGCDLAPQGADEGGEIATVTANEVVSAVPGGTVLMLTWWFPDVTGRRYAGWHAASAGPTPSIRSAYAVWYSYSA